MSNILDFIGGLFKDIDNAAATGGSIDLSDNIKLPTVNTSIELSKTTIAVIGVVLAIVALFVFKPRALFKKR